MRWGSDDIGVVLTRNELWLLLHALADASPPAVDWEGNRVEPWVVGELRSRLQASLRPDPVSDVEERPIIRLDSEMGRSLAQAGVRPLVLPDGYDLGSLISACAERGWGVSLDLPLGSSWETPAEAKVRIHTDKQVENHTKTGEGLTAREFVGLERPVVALARALIGAIEATLARTPGESGSDTANNEQPRANLEEYAIPSAAMNPNERDALIEKMANRGWELVTDDGSQLTFKHGQGADS